MNTSEHLDELLRGRGSTDAQIVFVDIEKYSQRPSFRQLSVVQALNDCIKGALVDMEEFYLANAPTKLVDFSTDSIALPTGDGAAVVFTYSRLPDAHLTFARALLCRVHAINKQEECAHFEANGWCEDHNYFRLRVGINSGKVIVYRDLHGNYNAAGGALNMAARVMDMMDGGQIGLTWTSWHELADLDEEIALSTDFAQYRNLTVKHGQRIGISQYLDHDDDCINSSEPSRIREQMATQPSRQRTEPAASAQGKSLSEFTYLVYEMRTSIDEIGDTTAERITTVRVDGTRPLEFVETLIGGDDPGDEDEIRVHSVDRRTGEDLNLAIEWARNRRQGQLVGTVRTFLRDPIQPGETAELALMYSWPRQNPQLGRGETSRFTYEGTEPADRLAYRITLKPSLVTAFAGFDIEQSGYDADPIEYTKPDGSLQIDLVQEPAESDTQYVVRLTPRS